MSELSSALFSTADDNEFRFARFYIVCEAVPLGAPESPLIVCGLPDTPRGTVQTWKDTEFDVRFGLCLRLGSLRLLGSVLPLVELLYNGIVGAL